MYDLAAAVEDTRTTGTVVTLIRVVEVHGISSRVAGAAAYAEGSLLAGTVLNGAVDTSQQWIADGGPLLTDLVVGDAEAAAAGLSCGGTARVLVQPADQLPESAWSRLLDHDPVALVTGLDNDRLGHTEALTPAELAAREADLPGAGRLAARGSTVSAVIADALVTVYWPTPHLLVVGDGLIADALTDLAARLDWTAQTVDDAITAAAGASGLRGSDAIVVLSHDRAVDGPALSASLSGRVGYVGALGSRHTQAARAQWLGAHGVDDAAIDRIHGPAGLDVGACTPYEIAVSIVAEILAVRSGGTGRSLHARGGPVHPDGVHAPPPRH